MFEESAGAGPVRDGAIREGAAVGGMEEGADTVRWEAEGSTPEGGRDAGRLAAEGRAEGGSAEEVWLEDAAR